jgi:hypothetical protein
LQKNLLYLYLLTNFNSNSHKNNILVLKKQTILKRLYQQKCYRNVTEIQIYSKHDQKSFYKVVHTTECQEAVIKSRLKLLSQNLFSPQSTNKFVMDDELTYCWGELVTANIFKQLYKIEKNNCLMPWFSDIVIEPMVYRLHSRLTPKARFVYNTRKSNTFREHKIHQMFHSCGRSKISKRTWKGRCIPTTINWCLIAKIRKKLKSSDTAGTQRTMKTVPLAERPKKKDDALFCI